ncbi:MAG: acetoacetate decarboxylase family protein [Anaerolineae bacterium]
MITSKSSIWSRFVRATKKPVWYAVHRLTGKRMGMPVHYLDMTLASGVFRLDAEQAAQLVSKERFVPSIAEDGLARCHVSALEYRNIDILYPYNELAITIPGRMRGVDRETELEYYLHLPVTTEDARWPGVEVFGFPKFLAAIDFQQSEGEIICSLGLAGQEVLRLQVSKGETTEDEWEVANLTFLQGEPVLSTFRGYGQRHASDVPGGAKLHLGAHEMAQELGAAGLELTSVAHTYCPEMRALLSTPTKLQ